MVELFKDKEHLWISLTGGGGKTTLMQTLASEYGRLGKSVLMTTTTKIQNPEKYSWKADFIFTSARDVLNFKPEKSCIVLYAESSDNPEKLKSPDTDVLKRLAAIYDVVLCEADGSKQKPLKVHTEKDPVIVSWNDYTLCLFGSWAYGRMLNEVCFGFEKCPSEFFCVDTEFLNWYFKSGQGLFKNTKQGARAMIITGECSFQLRTFCQNYCNSNGIPLRFI